MSTVRPPGLNWYDYGETQCAIQMISSHYQNISWKQIIGFGVNKLISRNFCQNIKKWNFNIFLSLKFHVKSHFTLCIHIYIIQKSKLIFAKNCVDLGHCYTLWKSYSVSTLKTTIFREIISLVICSKGQFQIHFSQSLLTPYFETLMGGNTYPLLPPIRIWKPKVN